jgi:hypothetical protein
MLIQQNYADCGGKESEQKTLHLKNSLRQVQPHIAKNTNCNVTTSFKILLKN